MSHGKVNSVCCQLKKQNALPFKDYITLAHTFCLLQVQTKTALLFKSYITLVHTFCLLQRIRTPFSKTGCFGTGLIKLRLVLINSKIHNPENKQTESVTATTSFHLVRN